MLDAQLRTQHSTQHDVTVTRLSWLNDRDEYQTVLVSTTKQQEPPPLRLFTHSTDTMFWSARIQSHIPVVIICTTGLPPVPWLPAACGAGINSSFSDSTGRSV